MKEILKLQFAHYGDIFATIAGARGRGVRAGGASVLSTDALPGFGRAGPIKLFLPFLAARVKIKAMGYANRQLKCTNAFDISKFESGAGSKIKAAENR